MTETRGPRRTLREWNENGRLYLWGGAISAVISWLLVPLFGLLAVFCGVKLYSEEARTTSAALIAGLGGIGFVSWIVLLVLVL